MGMKRNSAHFSAQGQGGNATRMSSAIGQAPANGKRPSYPKNDAQIKHMFRNSPGHLPDTPKNRNIVATVASDEDNFIGTDKHRNRWYSKTLDGKQYWVKVRNDVVVDCGMNDKPRNLDEIFDRKDKNKK